jgi:hypothetical protein
VKFKYALLSFLFITATSVMGRSPAVEPVTGISIDQYEEVNPSNDPGFNWNTKLSKAASTTLVTTRVPAQNGLIKGTTSQGKSLPTTLFLIGLLTLPFFLWKGLMKGLEKSDSGTANAETVDLMSEREKRNQSETQEIKKKAS